MITQMKPRERSTKYVVAAKKYLYKVGHATNAELLAVLQRDYPQLSATTIHRITTRLMERGDILLAPVGQDNVLRFDANTEPHDHFMCMNCGLLRDTILDDKVRSLIEGSIGDGCEISGRLVVSGLCKNCKRRG